MSRRALVGRRDERGSGLIEFIWLGILLIVPLVWIVLSVFEVQRGAFAVSAAARAAGRAYVLAPDEASARARATEAARQTLKDQGGPDMPLDVEVDCSLGAGRCLAGTSVVTVTISSGVTLPMVPEIFRRGQTDFDLEARHRVPIGQYVEGAP
ncbi:hypothetical protein [Nocardioides daphniae]|uniref:Pilus assembly protein n=1 Tax=Nocardioides daphniae TaxID=402297 RepID=A0A4P7UAM3_9ACTN|nr:hypothetical protein [Nocardioides daphniae]QCC76714.1 hypothetical protein E2C04_04830 [Nocardioides daphniae]GGD15594.1 hypothetical protein GCM10007231_13270 [Nocardioides daphniae]